MASKELKKQISTYILPILFCGLLIVLALLRNEAATPTAARVIEAGEPLTLTDMALENYLYGDGFTLDGKRVLDGQGQEVAALTVTKGEDGTIADTSPLDKLVAGDFRPLIRTEPEPRRTVASGGSLAHGTPPDPTPSSVMNSLIRGR